MQFCGVSFEPMDHLTLEAALAVTGNDWYPLEANHVFWACVGVRLCRLNARESLHALRRWDVAACLFAVHQYA